MCGRLPVSKGFLQFAALVGPPCVRPVCAVHIDELAGTFAWLGLALNGLVTALFAPALIALFR
jgi:hypothetical protein